MDDAPVEIERLKAECRRLSDALERAGSEIKELKGSLDQVAAQKLELLANNLSRDIREDFWKSVKTGLYVAALLAGIATAGGLLTLSDVLKSRVELAVEGKRDEINKLRDGLVDSLILVKTNAKQADEQVEVLKAQVATGNKQVDELKKKVQQEADRAVAAIGVDVKAVTARLSQYQTETQRELDEARRQTKSLQVAVESAVQQSSATAQRLDIQSAQVALSKLGRYRGAPDGMGGPMTVLAIRTFQRDFGLPETGSLDRRTLEKLSIEAGKVVQGTAPAPSP